MEKIKVALFVPEKTKNQFLDISRLNAITGKDFRYAAKGRYAIGHILEEYKDKGNTVLLPAYFCPSVLEVIKRLNLSYEFYDLDLQDLNPSAFSIERMLHNSSGKICAVIVPSFYGNPADLPAIWDVCKKYKIPMLDDAAQSFGSMLDGKYVGTFGDGGLFAFSPGKATAGHMGSFFWSRKEAIWRMSRHPIYHRICYKNYIENRLKAYENPSFYAGILKRIYGIWDRFFYVGNDKMEAFESDLLGGFLWDNIALAEERRKLHKRVSKELSTQAAFRVIQACRGKANPCKIVLLFQKEEQCNSLKKLLEKNRICYFGGYDYLPGKIENLTVTSKVVNHVIELPLEMNDAHMDYMCRKIRAWGSSEK